MNWDAIGAVLERFWARLQCNAAITPFLRSATWDNSPYGKSIFETRFVEYVDNILLHLK